LPVEIEPVTKIRDDEDQKIPIDSPVSSNRFPFREMRAIRKRKTARCAGDQSGCAV
jgi:hypothetical protein